MENNLILPKYEFGEEVGIFHGWLLHPNSAASVTSLHLSGSPLRVAHISVSPPCSSVPADTERGVLVCLSTLCLPLMWRNCPVIMSRGTSTTPVCACWSSGRCALRSLSVSGRTVHPLWAESPKPSQTRHFHADQPLTAYCGNKWKWKPDDVYEGNSDCAHTFN